MTLLVETTNDANAKLLAIMLRNLNFVKNVIFEPSNLSARHSSTKQAGKSKPLTDDDWIKPGRPATDEEIEQLCSEMEAETGGIEASLFFKQLKNKYKK